jgi:hypothetical protein
MKKITVIVLSATYITISNSLTLNKSYHVISSIQQIQIDQQLALGLSEYNTFYFILCDDNKIRELISTDL